MRIFKNSLALLLFVTLFTSCGNAQKENNEEKKATNSSEKTTSSSQQIKTVSIQEAQNLIADKEGLVIVDLRTDNELENGKLKDAVQINFNDPDFKTRIETLDKSKPYLIYCHSGGRSGQTKSLMKQSGFDEVYEMSAGFSGWSQQNLPLEKSGKNIEATEAEINNYNSKINKKGLTYVNFYATWCGVCKKNRPLLQSYSNDNENLTLVEYDVDQSKGLKNHLKIGVVPTLLIYKNGEEIKRLEGVVSKDQLKLNE